MPVAGCLHRTRPPQGAELDPCTPWLLNCLVFGTNFLGNPDAVRLGQGAEQTKSSGNAGGPRLENRQEPPTTHPMPNPNLGLVGSTDDHDAGTFGLPSGSKCREHSRVRLASSQSLIPARHTTFDTVITSSTWEPSRATAFDSIVWRFRASWAGRTSRAIGTLANAGWWPTFLQVWNANRVYRMQASVSCAFQRELGNRPPLPGPSPSSLRSNLVSWRRGRRVPA